MSFRTNDPGIDPKAIEEFRASGYHIARALFAEEEVDEIRGVFMRQNENGPVPGLSEIAPSSGRGYSKEDPLSFYPRMMMPHLHLELEVGPVSRKRMLDSRLHRYLLALMRDEPVAVQSMFYFKPPRARGQELHQDNYYLRVKPGTCMAAWLAVDDADQENGGMMVVPGTQDLEIACPEAADPETSFTTDYVRPPKGLVPVQTELKAGDVLFFNGSIVHGSPPNSSDTRFRRAFICHYIPETSTQVGHFYREFMETFDGRDLSIPIATDGGPCGTAQPLSRH